MTSSDDLIRRREDVVCRGVGRLSDLTAARAVGARITDAEGREFIDFAGGIGVMNVGHCDPGVVEAIREQAGMLLHASIHVTTYEPYIELCEKLVELLPHGPAAKAMLVNSGAEAVENAVKIARQATGRPAVICFTGGFHGRTLLTTTLTSKINYKTGCGPFAPEIYRLPFPVVGPRQNHDEIAVVRRELNRLRAAFKDTVAAADVAAIILELVQGEGGFHVAPKPYVEGLREICDEHGIVLIFDEVQTGFARTGRWAASEHYGVTPDLSTWAKSMGGGLPIAAVIGRAEVMDKVTPGTLGGTYGGNPVACAAALATIRRMETLGLNDRAASQGVVIRDRFKGLAARVREVTDVRGLGAMIGIEFCKQGDPARPAGALVKRIVEGCQSRGLLVISAGVEGNVIRVLAPIVISADDLNAGLDIFEHTVVSLTSLSEHEITRGA
ncbi:MAG: aspartate aminotransferase family protein [Phycisphaerales bacterium]|nr:aspartate aminotransferase family protein [Phycisphaerales bacterium]